MNWTHLHKYLWNFLKFACSIAFIIQISASVKSQISPENTVTKTVKTNLENVDFPVAFKVCMKPSFSDEQMKKVGYEDPYSYFAGRSKYEYRLDGMGRHGWAGHTAEGGVFSNASDVQKRIFMDYHSTIDGTILETNHVFLNNISTSNYQLQKPNYPNNCLTLDIGKYLTSGERVKIVSIRFDASQFATDIDVIIEDRLILLDRTTMFSTRNQPIKYDNLSKNLTKSYIVTLKQNIYQDKENTFCVNYPTKNYKSLNDCDNQYLGELLQKVDLYPAWAFPKDLSKATHITNSSGLGNAISYFLGTDPGPCVEPCTQTSIQAVYKQANRLVYKGVTYPTVALYFNPTVEVTTHAMPLFNPLDVLQVGYNAVLQHSTL